MDWEAVLIEWVNCLRLTEHPIARISDVSDGKFFCEVLQIRFDKIVNIQDTLTVFRELEKALQGKYAPSSWINFTAASKGDERELVRILSVLIATCSLQDQTTLFCENPASYLSPSAQHEIKRYLQSVLQNSKVVSEDLLSLLSLTSDKENQRPHASCHFKKKAPPRKVPQSPHIYVSSPHTPILQTRRERESSTDTERHQAETIEKINSELLAKSSIISELESRISELTNKLDAKAAELKNVNEKNSHLRDRVVDLEKLSEGLTEDVQAKSDTVYKTAEQLTDLKTQLAKADVENEKLIEQNSVLKKERDNLIEHAQILEKEYAEFIESTNVKTMEYVQEIDKKQKELEELRESNSVLDMKCTHLMNSLESYKNSLDEAKLNLEKSEEEFSSSLNSLSIDLEKERERACSAEQQLEEKLILIKEMGESIEGYKEELSEALNVSNILKAELESKCDELTEAERILNTKQDEITKLSKQVAALLEDKQNLSGRIHTVEKEYADFIESTNLKTVEYVREIDNKQKELNELRENYSALELQCTHLMSSLESSKKSLDEAKLNLETSEEEFKSSLNSLSIGLEKERERACSVEQLLEEKITSIKEMGESIEGNKEDLSEAMKVSRSLKNDLDSKVLELDEAERTLHTRQEEISDLSTQVSELSNQLDAKGVELKSMNEKNSHLRERVTDLEKLSDDLTEDVQAKSDALLKTTEELINLKTQLVKADAGNEKLMDQNTALNKERDTLLEQVQILETDLQTERERACSAEQQLEEKLTLIKDMGESIERYQTEQAEVMKISDNLKTELESKCDELAEAERTLNKKQDEITKLSKQVAAQLEDKQNLSGRIHTLEKEYADFIESTNLKTAEYVRKIDDKEKELKNLRDNYSALDVKCTHLMSSLESSKCSLDEAKLNLEKSEKEFRSSLNSLSIELEMERERACSAEQQLEEKLALMKEMGESIEGYKEELSEALKVSNILKAELESKYDELAEAESTLNKKQEEISELSKQVAAQLEDKQNLSGRIHTVEKEHADFIESTNLKTAEYVREIDDKQKELKDLQENYSALELQCTHLMNSLESSNKNLDETKLNLENSKEEFRSSLNSLSIELEKERERACSVEQLLEEKLTSMKEMGESIEGYKTEQAEAKKISDNLKTDLDSKCDELAEAERSLNKKQDEITKLSKQVAAQLEDKQTLSDRVRVLEKEHADFIESTNLKTAEYVKEIDKKQKELEEVRESHSALDMKCTHLMNSLESYKNSLDEAKLNLEKSEEEFKSSLNSLSIDLEKERERTCNAEQQLEERLALIKEMGESIEGYKTEQAEAKKISDNLKTDLDSKCDELAETERTLNKKLEETTKLSKQVAALLEDKQNLSGRIHTLEKEYADFIESTNLKTAEYVKEIDNKRKELEDLRESNSALDVKCTHLMNSLESSKCNLDEAKLNREKSEEEFKSSLNSLSIGLEKERERTCNAEQQLEEKLTLIKEMGESIERYQTEQAEVMKISDNLKTELESKYDELTEAERTLNKKHEEITELSKQVAALLEDKQNLSGRIHSLEKEYADFIESTNLKTAEYAQEIDNKQKELEDLRENYSALELQCTHLMSSLESSKCSLDEAKLNLEKSEEKFRSSLNSLAIDLERERERACSAEQLVEEKLTLIKEMGESIEGYKEDLSEAMKVSRSLKNDLDSKVLELDEAERTLHTRQEEISDLSTQVSELSNQLDAKGAELKSMNEKNSHLRDRVGDLEKLSEGFAEDLQAKSDALLKMTEDSTALRTKFVKTDAENEKLIEQNTFLKRERDNLTERAQIREKEHADFIESTNVKTTEYAQENDNKQKELEDLRENYSALELQCTHLMSSLESSKCNLDEAKLNLKKSEEEFSSSLNSLSIELEKERQRTCSAEQQLEEKLTLMKEMGESIEGYKEELSEARKVSSSLKAELELMGQEMAKLKSTCNVLKLDLEAKSAQYDTNERQLADLNSQLQRNREEMSQLKEEMARVVEDKGVTIIETERKLKAEMKEKFSKKLDEMKTKMARITGAEIEKVHAELSRKNEELAALQQNMAQTSRYEDELIDLKRERGLLKSANVDANNRLFTLNEALNRKTLEYNDLRRKYEDMSLQVDLWKRKYDMLDVPDCSSIKGLSYAGSSISSLHSNLGLDERRSSCVSLASIKSNGSTSSRKFVPQGAGSMFTCEDEDDGQFSEKHLADFHQSSRYLESTRSIEDNPQERISEIQRRNTLLPVHMRSCYPSEDFGNDLPVDENQLRLTNINGKKLGRNPGLQRQYATLSLSKLKDVTWDDDVAPVPYQQRTPFSPTSSRLNKPGIPRPSTSLGFSPMKPKMKSDSALTPRKKSKPSMFRVPLPRD